MLKFLLICLGITIFYVTLTAYAGKRIMQLEEQHNNDMTNVWNSITNQNTIIQNLMKQNICQPTISN